MLVVHTHLAVKGRKADRQIHPQILNTPGRLGHKPRGFAKKRSLPAEKGKTHHPSLRSRAGYDTETLIKHGEKIVPPRRREGAEKSKRGVFGQSPGILESCKA